MNAVTLSEAKESLEELIKEVLSNAEPTIVLTDKGERVVIIPLDEFNSWQETIYLLSNPANAAHLRKSIQEAETGKVVERGLIEE